MLLVLSVVSNPKILQKEGRKKNSMLTFYSSFNKTKHLTKAEDADFLNVLLRKSKLS